MSASTTVYVILGLLLALLIFAIALFNGLVAGRNRCRNAWSQIDVQLKRRHDLIPNLVETVKGFAQHEEQTLTQVIEARGAAVSAKGVAEKGKTESILSGALGNLLALSESYPDLKANQNFLALQEEITSTENKIGFARQNYNDQVLGYNNKVQMFPSNIVAGMFGFSEEESFILDDFAAKEAPKVSF